MKSPASPWKTWRAQPKVVKAACTLAVLAERRTPAGTPAFALPEAAEAVGQPLAIQSVEADAPKGGRVRRFFRENYELKDLAIVGTGVMALGGAVLASTLGGPAAIDAFEALSRAAQVETLAAGAVSSILVTGLALGSKPARAVERAGNEWRVPARARRRDRSAARSLEPARGAQREQSSPKHAKSSARPIRALPDAVALALTHFQEQLANHQQDPTVVEILRVNSDKTPLEIAYALRDAAYPPALDSSISGVTQEAPLSSAGISL